MHLNCCYVQTPLTSCATNPLLNPHGALFVMLITTSDIESLMGIQLLTPQWVFDRLSSKSTIFFSSPQWTLLVVTLTIHLWQFLPDYIRRQYQFSHGIYDQILFPPVKFFLFTIMSSSSPLNDRNPELGGFSISHVQSTTSELTDNQVSSSSPVGTTPLSLCPVRHLWTVRLWI